MSGLRATINEWVRAGTDNVKKPCAACLLAARDPKHSNPLIFAKWKQVFLGNSSRGPPRRPNLRCLPLEVGRLEVLGVRLAAPSARPAAAASAAAAAPALRLAAVDADEDEDEQREDGGHEDDRDQGLLRHVI